MRSTGDRRTGEGAYEPRLLHGLRLRFALRLARRVDTWWPQIEAFLLTGIANAASKGHSRVATRRGRGCLNPAQDR